MLPEPRASEVREEPKFLLYPNKAPFSKAGFRRVAS